MVQVHPTAILDDRVTLADDVKIGPYAILEGQITIGKGTRVRSHAFMQGPLVIGEGNDIWPFSSIGTAPQTSNFNPDDDGPGTIIGDNNTFREHSTLHRAIHETEPTRVGNGNLFMGSAHAGHDVQIHNNIILAQGCVLGGHVTVEDCAIVGGSSGVHQFCRIGRGSLIGGTFGLTRDLMPWFTTSEFNVAVSINAVGMKRSGYSSADIDTARWVYKLICRSRLTIAQARQEMEKRRDDPIVAVYLTFMDNATRRLCTAHGRSIRSGVPSATVST